MRRALLAAVLVGVAAPASAVPPAIAGRWLTDDASAIVEIAPCGPALCGRIATVLKHDPAGATTDVHNPDVAQRGHPIQGIVILSGFIAAGDRWTGRIYDPRVGRTYRSELTRDGGVLHVKGCIGPFCRRIDWTRAG